jgi:hypothetical protein
MGWACGAYGGGERCAQGFGGEAPENETIRCILMKFDIRVFFENPSRKFKFL